MRRAGQSREDYGLVAPYAESGQDGQDAPLTQVAGRLVRLVCWLSTLVQPVPSRKRTPHPPQECAARGPREGWTSRGKAGLADYVMLMGPLVRVLPSPFSSGARECARDP